MKPTSGRGGQRSRKMGTSNGAGGGGNTHDTVEARRDRERRKRNCVAAQRIRDRKKAYQEELENQSETLAQEQARLAEQLASLESDKRKMRRDIAVYKKVMQFGLSVDPALVNQPDVLVDKLRSFFGPRSGDGDGDGDGSKGVEALLKRANFSADASLGCTAMDTCNDSGDASLEDWSSLMRLAASPSSSVESGAPLRSPSLSPCPSDHGEQRLQEQLQQLRGGAASCGAGVGVGVGVDGPSGSAVSLPLPSGARQQPHQPHQQQQQQPPTSAGSTSVPWAMMATMLALTLCSPSQTSHPSPEQTLAARSLLSVAAAAAATGLGSNSEDSKDSNSGSGSGISTPLSSLLTRATSQLLLAQQAGPDR